jgi:NADPH-dependent glutamate synthase beta subunit-like oxidoreductase
MNPHLVAIFGGAVSGAEAAHQLAQRGIRCVVFEQNALPYGKIEDGLPKWHAKLRDKEEGNIDEKLSHPLVTYVPNVRLGEDLDFADVVDNWGFSAVFLATGAWRDRPLPIDGIDGYVGKGLYYQNPFIYWYNHFHEPGFDGEQMEIHDGALVVGGGLASIDVVKALMMETLQKALAVRGHQVNMFDLERGIAKVLEGLNLTLDNLGIKGCTLMYRRRVKDMPLFPGDTDTPEKLAKAEVVREKVLTNAQSKFLFQMLPCHVPVDKIVENGRLAGLVLRQTEIAGSKVVELPGTEKEFRAPLVISSIGSIPEPIAGIPMKWQVFEVETGHCCRLKGFKNVFALGNAVTGRGNIKESMEHGREVSQAVAEHYLNNPEDNVSGQFREREAVVSENVVSLAGQIEKLPVPAAEVCAAIFEKIASLHRKAGYNGSYPEWVSRHLPVRLEALLGLDGH